MQGPWKWVDCEASVEQKSKEDSLTVQLLLYWNLQHQGRLLLWHCIQIISNEGWSSSLQVIPEKELLRQQNKQVRLGEATFQKRNNVDLELEHVLRVSNLLISFLQYVCHKKLCNGLSNIPSPVTQIIYSAQVSIFRIWSDIPAWTLAFITSLFIQL